LSRKPYTIYHVLIYTFSLPSARPYENLNNWYRSRVLAWVLGPECPVGGSFFYRGEEVRCPIFSITRSKGGRRASSRLSTKVERLSTRILAARLTTSLRRFLADHFFTFFKKRSPPRDISTSVRSDNANTFERYSIIVCQRVESIKKASLISIQDASSSLFFAEWTIIGSSLFLISSLRNANYRLPL